MEAHRQTISHLLIAKGRKTYGEDGFTVHWWLMSSLLSDEDALYLADNPRRFYHGPGRAFGCEPMIRRQGRRLLVKWHTGLDV